MKILITGGAGFLGSHLCEALLKEGVMQFIRISEFDTDGPDGLISLQPETALGDITDLRKRVEGVLHTIGVIPLK